MGKGKRAFNFRSIPGGVSIPVRAAAALAIGSIVPVTSRATDYTSTLRNTAYGLWTNSSNWITTPSSPSYPGYSTANTYDVYAASGEITLDTSVTLRSLNLSSAAFVYRSQNQTDSATVTNLLTLNGTGTGFQAPIILGSSAKLNLAGNGALVAGPLTVAAAIELAPSTSPYVLSGGGSLNLQPTATFHVDRPLTLVFPGASDPFGHPRTTLNNAGLIEQAAGTPITSSDWDWNNTGTMRVNAAFTLTGRFSNTGTLDLASSSSAMSLGGGSCDLRGAVHLAPASVLSVQSFSGGIRGGAVFDNAGTIRIDCRDLVNDGKAILSGNVQVTTNLASISLNNGDLSIPDTAVTLKGVLVTGTGRVTINRLTAPSLTINQNAEVLVPAGGTFSLPAGGSVYLGSDRSKLTIGGTASLAGTIDWGSAGRVEFLPGAVVNVAPSATANLRLASDDRSFLVNHGQFLIDHGSLVTGDGQFDNGGTVRVTAGTHTLGFTSITNSGVLDFQASAKVTLSVDQLSNSGLINLDQSTLTVAPRYAVNTGTIRASGGSGIALGSSATNSGVIDFRSGSTVTIGGNTANDATGIITASGPSTTVTFVDGGNAGLIALDTGATIKLSGFFRAVNSGTIKASGANVTFSQAAFTDSGTVQLDAGTKTTGTSDQFDVTPTGALRLTGGSTLNLQGSRSANFAGIIDVHHATFAFKVPAATNSGTIHVAAGGTAYVNSNLTNTGVIELDPDGAAGLKTSVTDARAQIRDGHIRAGQAASDPGAAVAMALASDLGVANTWRGVTVSPNDILFFPARFGDANLDGAVDFNDLVRLAQNYNTADIPAKLKYVSWLQGDFTTDGIVDFNDLVKLAQNYNTALPASPIPGAAADFNADLARAFASVPEPSGVLVALFAACGFALPVRRRSRRPA